MSEETYFNWTYQIEQFSFKVDFKKKKKSEKLYEFISNLNYQ